MTGGSLVSKDLKVCCNYLRFVGRVGSVTVSNYRVVYCIVGEVGERGVRGLPGQNNFVNSTFIYNV